jgi:hypothetical protein
MGGFRGECGATGRAAFGSGLEFGRAWFADMNLSSFLGAGWAHGPQILGDEEGILLCRACRESIDGERKIVLAVLPAAEHPSPQSLDRLAHEFGLKDELDGTWAAKPLERWAKSISAVSCTRTSNRPTSW